MTADQLPDEGFASQNRKEEKPDPKWIKERFSYCPKTGKVFGLRSELKSRNAKGYPQANIVTTRRLENGEIIKRQIHIPCHQIAFALMTGRWPHLVNHKDGNPSNNKWENLEEATHQQNMAHWVKHRTYKVCEIQDTNKRYWVVSNHRKGGSSFRKYCKAWQYLQEMNAWREAGREGPAPKPKRDSRAGVPRN